MFLDCLCRDCGKLLNAQNVRVDGDWMVCKSCVDCYHLPTGEQSLSGSISELGTEPGDRCWFDYDAGNA
jgi:hypothetical protein